MTEEPVEITTVDEFGVTHYRFEPTFFRSNWSCIWGRGCLGIHDHPTPELQQGCCSLGAELADADEAMRVTALAAVIPPELFQFRDAALESLFERTDPWNTRLVDGACVFLNRPGFPGGAGCSLQLAASHFGESVTEWKPSVCWQLPIHVEWTQAPDEDAEIATVRRWTREDWDDEGRTMAWWCTEGDLAYVGDRPVIESLAEELSTMFPEPVYLELRRRLGSG